MKINGVFDKIDGLILGKHELFNDLHTGRTPADILTEVIGNLTFPILAEFDYSHTHPMLTMPFGLKAELNAGSQTLTLIGTA